MIKIYSFVEDKYVMVDDVEYVYGEDEIGECIVDRIGIVDGVRISLGM